MAVALDNIATCAAAAADQLRSPTGGSIIPQICKEIGINLGDPSDGEAVGSFVVVAVAASINPVD